MVASRSVEMSGTGNDTDDESEELSPKQYLKYRHENSCDASNETDNQMLGRIGLDIRIFRQAWRHLLEVTMRIFIIRRNSRQDS